MLLLLILIFAVVFVAYRFIKLSHSFWKNLGVANPPVDFLFGNVKESVFLRKSFGETYADIYREFKDLSYVGFYKLWRPGIVVRDSELISTVLVKEFQNFHDNYLDFDEKTDPVFSRNPFIAKGDKWKTYRNQITPSFSTGKMKAIFSTIQEVSKNFVDYIEREQKMCGEHGLDAREICAKFTTENVMNCGFGVEANCFNDDNSEYRKIGRIIMDNSLIAAISMMISVVMPPLSKFLRLRVIPEKARLFFRNFMKQILVYRQQNGIQRNDFFNNLMEVKNKNPSFTLDEFTSQSVALFFDGFETSSIGLSYILYELASNQKYQDLLKAEIDGVLTKGEVTFEDLQSMPLMDAVLKESLRLHPPLPFLMRRCTQATKFPMPDGTNDREIEIKEGTAFIIPVMGVHLDEKYYPEPSVFKPERFMGDQKDDLSKITFLPFGDGPRICIGMRFGLLQIKVAVFNIISKFRIEVNKNTPDPLEIDPTYWLLSPKGKILLNFHQRNN